MVRDRPSADTSPQSWSEDEEQKLLDMIKKDATKQEIYNEFNRPKASVDNKLRRIKKKNGLYNSSYADEKYEENEKWIELVASELGDNLRVFDAYAGVGNSSTIYDEYAEEIVACEIEDAVYESLETTLQNHTTVNDDCVNELMRRCAEGESFDFIDLDPFGTPFDAIPNAISLIRDGYMAVTYGDIKLQRWGRTNPLVKQYKMPETTDWREVAQYMVGWTVFEGIRQRESTDVRTVEPVQVRNFGGQSGVLRVLYRIRNTGVLSDSLENFEDKTIETDQALPNRPYDLSEFLDREEN